MITVNVNRQKLTVRIQRLSQKVTGTLFTSNISKDEIYSLIYSSHYKGCYSSHYKG